MEDYVNLFLNSGVTVGIIVFFMNRENTYMKDLKSTLDGVKDALVKLSHVVEMVQISIDRVDDGLKESNKDAKKVS